MRHPRRGWLVGMAAVALATGCQETLHLYASLTDGGAGAGAGAAGGAGVGAAGKPGTAGTGGLTVDGGGRPDEHCFGTPSQPLGFTADSPQVVVALDRSNQMYQPFGPNDSDVPLTVALNALYAEVGTYTPRQNPHVQDHPTITFSFLDFPDSDPGCSAPTGCCSLDVSRINGASSFMTAAYRCETPSPMCLASDRRPTATALGKAEAALVASTSTGPRYVVVITDGPPSGQCAPAGFNDCTAAVRQVKSLVDDGILTFIIGVGAQSSLGCLLDVGASAGGTGWPPYYAAATSNELTTAIFDVLASTVCHVTLTAPPSPNVSLSVSYGGTLLPADDRNSGWTYDSASGRLHLHGNACQNYAQYGSGALKIWPVCGHSATGPGSTPP